MLRIVVADDHPVVRAGIMYELARHATMQIVGEAASADQAFQLVHDQRPDVLLLDISMPGTPSIEIVRLLGSQNLPTRVVILTAHQDVETVRMLLKAGAAGYLVKDEDVGDIATAVMAVAHGQRWISPSITALLVNQALGEPECAADESLSEREVEVLQRLAEGKDNREIGVSLHISERTVRFHLRNIYDKLGVRRGGAIAWSIRNGLVSLADGVA